MAQYLSHKMFAVIIKGKKFKRSMLEYSKIILSKMAFDRKLFKKEYIKAFRYLTSDERLQLKRWVKTEMRDVLRA